MTYEIKTEDAYKDFWSDKDEFDNSEYPGNSPYFDKSNKKVIGKFKDEVSGIPINEFIGLRSKMYSYLKDTDVKGMKKNVIRKDIKYENYKDVLFSNKQVYHKMKTIEVKDID